MVSINIASKYHANMPLGNNAGKSRCKKKLGRKFGIADQIGPVAMAQRFNRNVIP
jgi:hypothetical protein